jgi:hypothetical protein
LSYLKIFPKGRIIIETSYPDHFVYPVEYHLNWMEFYPDASEAIPKNLPPEKGPRVRMTVYALVDYVHDLFTRRSITGIHINLLQIQDQQLYRLSLLFFHIRRHF